MNLRVLLQLIRGKVKKNVILRNELTNLKAIYELYNIQFPKNELW